MKQRKSFTIYLLTAIAAGFMWFAWAGCAQESRPISNLEDNAMFEIYVGDRQQGTIRSEIDIAGNYHRHLVATNQRGRSVEMDMRITPDKKGDWQHIVTKNPSFGDKEIFRDGNKARFKLEQTAKDWKYLDLPEGDYTFFDDHGNLFESVMIRKYDMEKKGKQVFHRFRIEEAPLQQLGNRFDVELEFLREEIKNVNGADQKFLIFNYKISGIDVTYWVDEERKLFMVDSPAEKVLAVRQGFGDLLQYRYIEESPKPTGAEIE